jgi:AraC-like DNA-binding protein
MIDPRDPPREIFGPAAVADLFDRLPDVVFFAKDTIGRYVAVNETLVRRLGKRSRGEVLGRTADELFPHPLGGRYLQQDRAVCRTGRPVEDLLELHLYPDGNEGWCITDKLPVRGVAGVVAGLVGVSRDVHAPAGARESFADLAAALRLIHERYGGPLRVTELAATARMSPYQFTRRVTTLFGLTPAQLIIKTRIDAARVLLAEGSASVAEIAFSCGYCDQSAFTRQFRRVVGLTPAQYRETRRGSAPRANG